MSGCKLLVLKIGCSPSWDEWHQGNRVPFCLYIISISLEFLESTWSFDHFNTGIKIYYTNFWKKAMPTDTVTLHQCKGELSAAQTCNVLSALRPQQQAVSPASFENDETIWHGRNCRSILTKGKKPWSSLQLHKESKVTCSLCYLRWLEMRDSQDVNIKPAKIMLRCPVLEYRILTKMRNHFYPKREEQVWRLIFSLLW